MDLASVMLVVAAVCVSFGWQPAADDPQAYEVVMQVEPELVDVLAEGREIPIESHVPANITPIRNVRVVVGTSKLPRTLISATADFRPVQERIVRGQEPAPVEQTVRFQNADGWSGDRYAPSGGGSRQFDQRGATIGADPVGTAEASPWTVNGAQQAANNAGNALRNSVNSTAEQTTQQVNQGTQQFLNGVQDSGHDFGQQLQNMSGIGSQSAAPLAASAAGASAPKRWPAPPPLATSAAAPPLASGSPQGTITPESWTSIRPELAPPRLATPPLSNGVRVAANPSTARSTAGPMFPPPPSESAAPMHSLLSDPAATKGRAAEQDWAGVWGTSSAPASTTAGDDASAGLVPVPPRPRGAAAAPAPASGFDRNPADPWPAMSPATISSSKNAGSSSLGDRYGGTTPAPPAANPDADAWANFGRPQGTGAGTAAPAAIRPALPEPVTAQTSMFGQAGQSEPATIASQTPATTPQMTMAQPANGTDEVPWKPLLGVSLALAGSVGANFFLGMSYADARRRYRSLVAKTTMAFQKEAGIAA